jgi:5-methylcytosine-specific restriction endonuclease McrA
VTTPAASIPPGLPRPERMARILERDGSCCVWCSRPLELGDRALTFEHVVPRLKGGPAWAENEVPACRACNRARGHVAPSLWLRERAGRGLKPRPDVVARALLALRAAIAERGGQRKARPYLEREIRRMGLD